MTARRRASARMALFGPAVPLAAAGWDKAGQPLHVAGLAVTCVLALTVVPLVLLPLCTARPAFPGCLVTRECRAVYRKAHGPREDQRSSRISKRLQRATFAADRHRCVACGRRARLQADHFCPWAAGGLTWLWNMVTLCGNCNRVKSSYWKYKSGYVGYRPFKDANDIALAAAILEAERRARNPLRHPARWLRAAWAL